jgi:competence ComEA-like helix-hairpin-helix protein
LRARRFSSGEKRMVFTAAERRLLALLVVFLALGYLLTGVRHCAGIDSARDARAAAAAGDSASARPCSAAVESVRVGIADSCGGAPPAVDAFAGGFLDLNAADSTDLLTLPGVGPAIAGRILAYRRAHGAFVRVEDLRGVKGIGPKRLERLRTLVAVRAPVPRR